MLSLSSNLPDTNSMPWSMQRSAHPGSQLTRHTYAQTLTQPHCAHYLSWTPPLCAGRCLIQPRLSSLCRAPCRTPRASRPSDARSLLLSSVRLLCSPTKCTDRPLPNAASWGMLCRARFQAHPCVPGRASAGKPAQLNICCPAVKSVHLQCRLFSITLETSDQEAGWH